VCKLVCVDRVLENLHASAIFIFSNACSLRHIHAHVCIEKKGGQRKRGERGFTSECLLLLALDRLSLISPRGLQEPPTNTRI